MHAKNFASLAYPAKNYVPAKARQKKEKAASLSWVFVTAQPLAEIEADSDKGGKVETPTGKQKEHFH